MIKLLKIVLIAILSVVTLFFLIVLRLYVIKIYDVNVQRAHMKRLISYYEDTAYQDVDESQIVNFDLDDNTIRLNEIQMLATHNSYKKTGSDLGRFFVGLGDSFDEARALKYGNKNLTSQLELGIRSMEFDVRLRKDQFMLTHVPLVDNSSVAPILSDALLEIKMFSDHHQNHVPIIILMEIKDDWMILDHALQNIGVTELQKLNTLLIDTLGDSLYQPKDMMETSKSLKETIQTTGWPTLSQTKGKIIVVLHPGSVTEMYSGIDDTLETLPMFIGLYKHQTHLSFASFIVHNDIDVASIKTLVDASFIVRTRIDSNLNFNQTNFDQAILSGAQILTSDFTIGRFDIKPSEVIYFLDEKMIVLKDTN